MELVLLKVKNVPGKMWIFINLSILTENTYNCKEKLCTSNI